MSKAGERTFKILNGMNYQNSLVKFFLLSTSFNMMSLPNFCICF